MSAYRAKPPKGARLNRADPLANGLLAAWLFNEGSGPVAYDSVSGKANDGTLTNFALSAATPGWASTPYGDGLLFDGSDDRIDVAGAALDIAGNITIVGLCYPKALSSATVHHLLGAYKSTTPFTGYGFDVGGNVISSGLSFWDGTSWRDSSSGVVVINAWQLVAVSVQGTGAGSVSFYVNGLAAGTATSSGRSNFTLTRAIGCRSGGGVAAHFFNGLIAGVWIYNRALNAGEHREMSADPFRMFRRRSVPVPLKAASGAGASGNNLLGEGTLVGAGRLMGEGVLVC